MSNGRVISFPIEFTVAQGNFKKIISELQQELTKIKPGTHIYDSLSEQLTRAQKLAEKTGTAIERGTTVSAGTRDIDAVLTAFQQLDNYIRNMQGTFGQLNFSDLNLGHSGIREEIQSLRALQTELENTAKLLDSKKNLTVGEALSGQNLTGALQSAQNRGALEYLTELESKIESARQQIAQLQQEQAQLQSSTAGAAGSKAQGFLNYFEGIKTLTESTKMGFADAFTGPKLRAMVDAANGGGADAQKYQNILSMLGLSQDAINAAMQEAGNNLTQAYQRLAQQLKQQAAGLMGQGGSLTKGGLTDLVKTAEQEQSKLQEIDKQLNATNNQLNNLQTSHGQLGAVVNPTEVQNLASKVTELSTKVAQLESKILNAQRTPPTNNPPSNYPTKPPAEMALQGEKIKQQEALGNSLDMYARRWFSAYAVINKISQAVRQAWSDIKALDSAMTNIAVVTDMSISELWGKLGDYMSIAQQYGVTTQGVYEVSQLYYQQGLSESDVMAATTETLKLARVAGMDYAEAADAMTVAIRSFKMEMTDAAHVTDVYSKVAAATASSQEELAIAMSKTASSADSVGSSFENTTAMLAVMIETTRESAQNLGSALKSIISRYGEMKVGSTVDADGEALDYNKVDTALKSVGISLKDAQGQFRDFDQVILELSKKWDSLDSVTQRYIATIMAGNRQQSRFIALVNNWERLDEVTGIAQNSEDAGLLQYAKTLDSFDAKLNKLKNSFQSFYMQLFDSNFFKGILDALNDILEGFSEIGPTSLAMLPTVLSGFKVAFSLIKLGIQSAFSEAFAYAKTQSQIATGAMVATHAQGEAAKTNATTAESENRQRIEEQNARETATNNLATHSMAEKMKTEWNSWQNGGWKVSKSYAKLSMGANLAGSTLSLLGAQQIGSGNRKLGSGLNFAGGILSGVGMGSSFGLKGAVIGGLLGGIAQLPTLLDAFFNSATKLKDKLKEAEETLEEANIERATKKQTADDLESSLNNLKKLQKARYESEEAEKAYLEASNAIFEKFPSLLTEFDDAGNAVIDVINDASRAEYLLVQARRDAAEAAENAAAAELKTAFAEEKVIEQQKKLFLNTYGNEQFDFNNPESPNNISERSWAAQFLVDYFGSDFVDKNKTLKNIISAYNASDTGYTVGGGIELLMESYLSGAFDNFFADNGKDFLENLDSYITGYGFDEGILKAYEDYNSLSSKEAANLARQKAGARMAGIREIDSLLLGEDPFEKADWRKINGSETFFAEYVLKKANIDEEDFDLSGNLIDRRRADLKSAFSNAYKAYGEFYSNLSYELDDFNFLIDSASKGVFSESEIDTQFEKLFGKNRENWDEIVKEYYNSIMEDIEQGQNRLKKDLTTDRTSVWKNYIKVDGNDITVVNEVFDGIIKKLPEKLLSYVSDFANNIDSRITSKSLSEKEAQNIIDRYITILNNLSSNTLNLTSPQLKQAQEIITKAAADNSLFSITGLQETIGSLQALGIDTAALGLDNLPIYTTNLITEWNALQGKIGSTFTSATDAMKKAAEGMDFEEALSLAGKIGLDLAQDFTFIDGKWYTSEVKKISDYYMQQTNDLIKKLNKEEEKVLGSDLVKIDPTKLNQLKEAASLQEAQAIDGLGGITQEVWQLAKTYWDPDKYKKWAEKKPSASLSDYWKDYFEELGKNIDESTAEALKYWTKESEKQAEEAKRLAGLKKQSQGWTDVAKAYKTISSQGRSGYAPEDLSPIIGMFGWDESYYELNYKTGTYELTQKAIDSLPQYVKNALNSVFLKESETALSSIENLGKNLFTAKETDYESAFTYLVEAGFQGKEIKKGINYSLMQAIAGDPKELKEYIGKELAHRKGVDYSDDFAAEYAEEIEQSSDTMVAAAKDAYIGKVKSFYDLAYKKIAGTATYTELKELDELSTALDIDLSSFNENLMSSLSAYAQQVADNAYISQENKEKALKQAAGLALDAKAVSEMYGLSYGSLTPEVVNNYKGLTSVNSTLVDSKNRMSRDQAASFFGAYTIGTGISLDTYMGMLGYNQADNTYSLIGNPQNAMDLQIQALESYQRATNDQDVLEALKAYKDVLGQEGKTQQDAWNKLMDSLKSVSELRMEVISILGNPEVFQKLANAYASADYLGNETKINKYTSAVKELAAGQEQTFEETAKLYEELGIDINPEELYKTWLQGPIAVLNDLGKHLDSGLDDYSKSLIKEATERGVANLITSITSITDKATSGTATYDEMKFLSKQLGLDLTGMMTKTGAGYGLNQRGQLRVAAARAQLSGDYVGESQALIETFTGKGGIFGATTGKVLDAALKAVKEQIKALDKQSENYEKEFDLLEAEQKVLEAAQEAYKQNAASDMSNFMGRDPYGGQSTDFDNYISSRKTAKEALGEAYTNKGVLKNYKQAAQMLDFVAYGQNWSPSELAEKQNILLDYVKEDGSIDMVAGLKEIFPKWKDLDLKGILEQFAALMDDADDVLTKQQKERAQNTNSFVGAIDDLQTGEGRKKRLDTTDGNAYLTENKIDLSKMSAVFGNVTTYKDGVETSEALISADLLARMAENAYGENWKDILSNDTEKRAAFQKGINSSLDNFVWDPNSKRSIMQQFEDHLLGETGHLKVMERLELLEKTIEGITFDSALTDPLVNGIQEAIDKILILQSLIKNMGGNLFTTGYNTQSKNFIGSIALGSDYFNADGSFIEDKVNDIREQLAEAWGLNKEEKKGIIWDSTNNTFSYTPPTASGEGEETKTPVGFEYKVKQQENGDNKNPPGVDDPLSGKVNYTGEFKEIDRWIAENTIIEGTYQLTTPKDFKDSLDSEIAALNDQIYNATNKDEEDSLKAQRLKLLTARDDFLKRYPSLLSEGDPGYGEVSITFTTENWGDLENSEAMNDLKALQEKGLISIKYIGDDGTVLDKPPESGSATMNVTITGATATEMSDNSSAMGLLTSAFTGLKEATENEKVTVSCNLESNINPVNAAALATIAIAVAGIAGVKPETTISVQRSDDSKEVDVGALLKILQSVKGLGDIDITVSGENAAGDAKKISDDVAGQIKKEHTIEIKVKYINDKGEAITLLRGATEDPTSSMQYGQQVLNNEMLSAKAVEEAAADVQRRASRTQGNNSAAMAEQWKKGAADLYKANVVKGQDALHKGEAEAATKAENDRRSAAAKATEEWYRTAQGRNFSKWLAVNKAATETDAAEKAAAAEAGTTLAEAKIIKEKILEEVATTEEPAVELEPKTIDPSLVAGPPENYFGFGSKKVIIGRDSRFYPVTLPESNFAEVAGGYFDLSNPEVANWVLKTGSITKHQEFGEAVSKVNPAYFKEGTNIDEFAQDVSGDHFTSMAALQSYFLKGVDRRFMDPTYWGLPKYSKRTTNPPSEDEGNKGGNVQTTTTEKDIVDEDKKLEPTPAQKVQDKVNTIDSFYNNTIAPLQNALFPDGALANWVRDTAGPMIRDNIMSTETYDTFRSASWSEEFRNSFAGFMTDMNKLGAFTDEYFGEDFKNTFFKEDGEFFWPENFNEELFKISKFLTGTEEEYSYNNFVSGIFEGIIDQLGTLLDNKEKLGEEDVASVNDLIRLINNFVTTNENLFKQYTPYEGGEKPPLTLLDLGINTEEATSKVNQFVAATEKASPIITIGTKILFNGFNLPGVQAAFTGNVNGIALADGNVNSLIAGAKLANKTLVGELGPELGVWDGQYHLLGQYGAEFADVPSDAIVFNHRQTEGILNGQWGVRGKALSGGNADGFQGQAYEFWTTASGFESYVDFLNNYGKKKRNSKGKAYRKEDLEEWYNLLRKIAKLEAEIKLIEAERANMLDGNEILRSYREQQTLLEEQIAVQKLLVDYQREQLKLEADRIKQSEFWNNSLTFNEDGTLLSIFGNEIKDGEGRLAFLDQLNQLTGDQQIKVLKQLGYTYKDKDGKQLTGEKLVEQFFKEYTEIITSYNELDDSILEAEEKIETLTTSINNLNKEIEDNQKKLEKEIYDLLVESSERDIKLMKEQSELLQKANQKYVENLSEALEREQSLYQQNLNTEERARLQRQLSLLRRSGGSASEIADLEKQLSETLKEEYFTNQQNMIDEITKANEEQTRLMEQQITLQEEALEYQKENGIIWTKVYDIMSGSAGSILDFLQGNSNKFFQASALEQKSMLLEWAKMVGIYDEDRAGKLFTADAKKQWENNEVLPNLTEEQQGHFDKLTDKDKKVAQEHYNTAYTSARLEGMSDEEARKAARDSMVERLRVDENGIARFDPHSGGSSGGSGSGGGANTQYVTVTYKVEPAEAKTAGCSISGPSRVAVGSEKGGLKLQTAKGWDSVGFSSSDNSIASHSNGAIKAHKKGSITITASFVPSDKTIDEKVEAHSPAVESDVGVNNETGMLSETISNYGGFKITDGRKVLQDSGEKYQTKDLATAAAKAALNSIKATRPKAKYTLYGFSQGGLVDYTGLAMVHGSQSKPEAFLNAAQTEQISEALRVNSGKNSLLENLQNTVGSLRALVHNIGAIDNSTSQDVTIAPGAIVINVDQLADSYDVETLSADIMNRMVSIASKATNRGVNRR